MGATDETVIDAGALKQLGLDADLDVSETVKPELTRAATRVSVAGRLDAMAALPPLDLKDGGDAELVSLEVLGEGGMGVVQLAEQRSLQRNVAVKRVHAGGEDSLQQALIREGTIMGSLEHPNIVPVHALGRTDSREPVLVMKRVSGVEWRDVLKDRAHPFWSSRKDDRLVLNLEVLVAVCNAVEFAHRQGVIHRDLKPANVMLGDFGEVYVLDWGIAMRVGQPPPEEPGTFAGTPAFAAPEMFDGAQSLDERTDVFLLGACLHLVLTGKPRHAGDNVLQVMASVLDCLPSKYGPSVPTELGEICNRACARSAADRFDSAVELRDALLDYLRHRGSLALADAGAERLSSLEAALRQSSEGPESVPGIADDRRIEITKLFGECRFAFEQALGDWEHNERAKEGLQSCLEVMIEFEITQRNHANAAALLAELPKPSAELAERVDRLRSELESDRGERERLEALDRDLDLSVSERPRSAALMALFLFILVVTPLLLVLYLLGHRQVDTKLAMTMALVTTAGMIIGGLWKRDVFLKNRANRQVAGLVLLFALGVSANRVAGLLLEREIAEVLVGDAIHGAFVCAAAGLVFRKCFFIPAAALVVAALASTQLGRTGPAVILGTGLASLVFLVVSTGLLGRARR